MRRRSLAAALAMMKRVTVGLRRFGKRHEIMRPIASASHALALAGPYGW
jgi:hypothetical protein